MSEYRPEARGGGVMILKNPPSGGVMILKIRPPSGVMFLKNHT